MIKSLSIIFPVYNESNRLKECFNDINKFNIIKSIKNIEYIFVDDGSRDNSFNLISQFIKKKKNLLIKLSIKSLEILKMRERGQR